MSKYYYYLTLVGLFADEIINYSEFSELWNKLIFSTQRPYDSLSTVEQDNIDILMNMFDYVSKSEPDKISRSYGYISPDEFKAWLKEQSYLPRK